MTDAELEALVARQVDALRRLSSDVGGCFTYAEDAVREAIGNTNYSVIMQWVAESHKALDEAPDLIAALATLRKQRDELREAGRAADVAMTAALFLIKRARDTVPDEEEGLAAKIFCHHLNHADAPMMEARETIRQALSNMEESRNDHS